MIVHGFGKVVFQAQAVAVNDAPGEPFLNPGGEFPLCFLFRRPVDKPVDEGVQRVVIGTAPIKDQILGHLQIFLRDFVQGHDLGEMHDGAGHAPL